MEDGNGGNNYSVEVAIARGTIKPFPNPNGMGGNDRTLKSVNLNLLALEKAWEDIRQKAVQGEFLERNDGQRKSTQTNFSSSSCDEAGKFKQATCL